MPLASTTAEIVIPIVTAVLGGLLGFLPTWYTAKEKRESERAGLYREVATEFAQKLGGVMEAARYAIDAPVQPDGGSRKVVDDAMWFLGEASARLPAMRLRLGSDAGVAARNALHELRHALDHLAPPDHDREEARAAYNRAQEFENAFIGATRTELAED